MPGSAAFDHNENFFLTSVQIMHSFDVPPFMLLPFPADYGGIISANTYLVNGIEKI